ncbi:30549_t:CDS:1, partial [Gigaspora margarita]
CISYSSPKALPSPINSMQCYKIGLEHIDQSLETNKAGYNALSSAKKLKIFVDNSSN